MTTDIDQKVLGLRILRFYGFYKEKMI